MWQFIDPVGFITDFADRIYHVDCKDTRMRPHNGRYGAVGSHLPWGNPRRGWDFVSTGHGDVPWEDCFRALRAMATTGRSPSNGRMREWTGPTAPPKQSSSSARCCGQRQKRLLTQRSATRLN